MDGLAKPKNMSQVKRKRTYVLVLGFLPFILANNGWSLRLATVWKIEDTGLRGDGEVEIIFRCDCWLLIVMPCWPMMLKTVLMSLTLMYHCQDFMMSLDKSWLLLCKTDFTLIRWRLCSSCYSAAKPASRYLVSAVLYPWWSTSHEHQPRSRYFF